MRVLPLAIVSVALVAGAVSVTLFIVVALATPRIGVTRVGDVASAIDPDPVVPLERLEAESCATVNAAPVEVCIKTCDVPPVAEKSVVPAGKVKVFDPQSAAHLSVRVPLEDPLRRKSPSVND